MIQAKIKRRLPGFELDVELTAAAGVTVLFGASGAGKTMTLDSIAGFVRPDQGRILLDDAILFDGSAKVHLPPQRRDCGYVFQNYALFPHMTLRGNLEFAVEHLPRLERHRRVNDLLERFKLVDVAARKPGELSGGQKQRCSIARALIRGPRALLLDEPSRGLDAPLRADLYSALRQVRQDFSKPIVVVTHDLAECFEIGEQMIVMRDGKVVQTGAPAEVVARPATLDVARLLGLYNLLPAEILTLDPQKNRSTLRVYDTELEGRYYPGHLKGDRVWISVRHSDVRATEGGSRGIRAALKRVTLRPRTVLAEFEPELAVELPREGFDAQMHHREWGIEFPPDAIHVLQR